MLAPNPNFITRIMLSTGALERVLRENSADANGNDLSGKDQGDKSRG